MFSPKSELKPLAGDPLRVTVHRLSNGLTVYLSPNPAEPRVHYEIAVRAGSRHDPLAATGMAHYLEHMQFKGTERVGTLDFNKERPHLERIESLYDVLFKTEVIEERRKIYAEIDKESQAAARYAVPNEIDRMFSLAGFNAINAHTGEDQTVYEGSFPANRAELWARIESDRLTAPVYRLFLPELEAVYEEYNKYRDNADAAFLCEGLRGLFKEHPYGRDIIGLGAHLKNPSISRMREFFRAYYRPNNMAIILSGDFDRRKMLALIKRFFGKLEAAPIAPPPAGEIIKLRGVERTEIFHQAEEKVGIGWLLPGHNHPDEDALTLMDMMMDNRWSGIFNLSVNKAQKVKESGSFPIILNEAGGWFAWASTKAGQTLQQAEAILLEAVEKLKAGDFKEADLKAVIVDFEVAEKKRLEKNRSRVEFIRASFIQGTQWRDALGRLDRLKRVAKADVLRVANQYLGGNRTVIYRKKGDPNIENVPKPAFTAIPIEAERQSRFSEELLDRPFKPLTPRFLSHGRSYQTLDRSWGRLYWTCNSVNDLFHIEFHFNFGSSSERKLRTAFRLLELSGAGSMSVEEFQRALYALGSTMEAGCGSRECVVHLSGLEKNFAETLNLALLRFLEPNIASGAFEKMIAVERGDRQTRKLDPKKVFNALEKYARRGAESSVLQDLSPGQLDALTQDDLKAILRSIFQYRMNALYTGSFKAEAAASLISKALIRLSSRPDIAQNPAQIIIPKRARVMFVHHGNMNQALIGAHAADGPYAAASRLEYGLFNTVMGGMSGVYFQEVREARALAYSAVGGYHPGERRGDENRLWSYAETQADKARQTSQLLQDLMLHPPMTLERFGSAQREMDESYRAGSLQLDEIPRQAYRWAKLGFSGDPRKESFRRLKTFKFAEIKKFAAPFAKKTLTFCVLADRSRVDLKGLKDLGDFQEIAIGELFPF